MNNSTNLSKRSFFGLVLLALIASYIPVLSWPLGWIETFFHEISHGLMALATGGDISRIELHLRGSGLCYTAGGVRILVSFSGYAGAVLWGAFLYLIVGMMNERTARALVSLLGILMVAVTLLWVRDLVSFFIMAVILGLVFTAHAAGRYRLTQWVVRFIALYVMLSAARTPLYLIDGRGLGDGQTLASLTGLPEITWVIMWEVIALSTLVLVYRRHKTNTIPTIHSGKSAVFEAH